MISKGEQRLKRSVQLSLRSFKYYLRYYSCECPDPTPQWWYNKITGQVVQAEHFSIEENDLWKWLPVLQIDIIELEKQFLILKGLKLAVIDANRIASSDFDIAFKMYIDQHALNEEWHSYEAQALETAAISWCNEYRIKFEK